MEDVFGSFHWQRVHGGERQCLPHRILGFSRAIGCLPESRQTNVLRSWHELARLLKLSVLHICDESLHQVLPHVTFASSPTVAVDIVVTDGWPGSLEALGVPLTQADLDRMDRPVLLPTPPFTMGREIAFDPLRYPRFAGYRQKELLLPVQKSILRYLLHA